MKSTLVFIAVTCMASAMPIQAQTSSGTGSGIPASTPTPQMIRDTLSSLHHGSKPLTQQEKTQETANLVRINDLTQAGTEALHLKNFAIAETDYRELVRIEANIPENYYGLGEALTGEGRTVDALAVYKTAVYWPLNTGPEGITFSRANGNPSNLRGCSFPVDAVAWMKYALLLSQTGQNGEAFSTYSQAVRHANDTTRSGISLTFEAGPPAPVELQAAAHIALGLLVNDTGNDREQAMSEFAQARTLAPDSAAANYYYGYGWKRLDLQSKTRLADAPQAKAALQKAALADDLNVKKAASEELGSLR